MTVNCSKETARKFILSKQLLFSPRKIAGIKGIATVFERLRGMQYDPQNPCGRSVDLSLQARVKGIHPSDYYQWLYEQRRGIEVYDKELTIVPIEDLPLCRGVFPKARKRKLANFLKSNSRALRNLLKQIEREGPLCSGNLEKGEKIDIFWEPTRWSKVALDSLWKIGKLVICRRENGRKYYDLPSRVYGEAFVWKSRIFEDNLQAECVLRRIKSVGMLPATGTGAGWLGVGSGKEIKITLAKLIKQGKIIEIEIGGLKEHYVAFSSDLDLLLSLEKKDADRVVSFLSPLDNLLWDRKMIRDIFGFDYKWEAYTRIDARKFGHYVLPILFGNKFIGRIEPKFNNETDTLEVKGFWIEPHSEWNEEALEALLRYLDEFQRYLRSKNTKWLCKVPKGL